MANIKFLAVFPIVAAISACTTAPCPQIEPVEQKQVLTENANTAAPQQSAPCPVCKPCASQQASVTQEATVPQEVSCAAQPSKKETIAATDPIQPVIIPQPETEVPPAPAEAKPSEEPVKVSPSVPPAIPNPKQDFSKLAHAVIDYASELYSNGQTDSAIVFLQQFRAIKPLWNEWDKKVEEMIANMNKSNAERAKQFEPLATEILNMNRFKDSYSKVAHYADSLISLIPGDSLVRFAKEQKSIAYKNTLKAARSQQDAILKLAEEQGKFAEAEKKALAFQTQYSDFEDSLQTKIFIAKIRSLSKANDAQAVKYWETHDPNEALAQVDALINAKKYSEAKKLLTKLRASSQRVQAIEKYNTLADAFCKQQRLSAGQLYQKSQSDAANKNKLIGDAVNALNKCIEEYPEYRNVQRVIENKEFLEKELNP